MFITRFPRRSVPKSKYLILLGHSNAMEQTLSPTEDLHKRCHSLITLTQLVSAMNKGGYPTLRTFFRRINSKGGPLDNVLHGIANILVRNTEAISVAVSGSSVVVMQGREEDTAGEPD